MSVEKPTFTKSDFSLNHLVRMKDNFISELGSQPIGTLPKEKLRNSALYYGVLRREIGNGRYPLEEINSDDEMPEKLRWNMVIQLAEHGEWDSLRDEIAKDAEALKSSPDGAKDVEQGYVLEELAEAL